MEKVEISKTRKEKAGCFIFFSVFFLGEQKSFAKILDEKRKET